MASSLRVLCLGNELLADDAFGLAAAEDLRRRFPQLDVVSTSDTGFHLLDYLSEVDSLVVVDSIQTGGAPPGTLYVLRTSDMKSSFGPSLHYIGLLETLQLAKELLFNVPEEVMILAVEVADCLTLGGKMHDAVKSSVDLVAELVAALLQNRGTEGVLRNKISGDGFERAIAAVSARYGSERLVVI